jgi:hypothetical protein
MVAESAANTGLLETEDLRFMSQLKHTLREGFEVFEELEGEAVDQSRQRLMDAARAIPNVLDGYYTRVYAGIQEIESSRG